MEGKNHKSPSKFMTCILVVNDLILCATLLCNFRKENDHYTHALDFNVYFEGGVTYHNKIRSFPRQILFKF